MKDILWKDIYERYFLQREHGDVPPSKLVRLTAPTFSVTKEDNWQLPDFSTATLQDTL